MSWITIAAIIYILWVLYGLIGIWILVSEEPRTTIGEVWLLMVTAPVTVTLILISRLLEYIQEK